MSRTIEEIRNRVASGYYHRNNPAEAVADLDTLLSTIDAGRLEANELFDTSADQEAEIDLLKAQLKEAEEVLIRIRNYHTDMNIALGKMGECKCPDCCDILHYQKEIKP